MPKRKWTQTFGQDTIVVADPRNAYYGLVTKIEEAVGSNGDVESHISFDCALVSFHQDPTLLANPPDPRTIAMTADTRLLVLVAPAAELDAFNQQMLALGRPHGLTSGTWWVILPSPYNLRGSLRVDVYRPPAGATDPSRIVDNDARDEEMYILPRLFVPLLLLELEMYAYR